MEPVFVPELIVFEVSKCFEGMGLPLWPRAEAGLLSHEYGSLGCLLECDRLDLLDCWLYLWNLLHIRLRLMKRHRALVEASRL